MAHQFDMFAIVELFVPDSSEDSLDCYDGAIFFSYISM